MLASYRVQVTVTGYKVVTVRATTPHEARLAAAEEVEADWRQMDGCYDVEDTCILEKEEVEL